MSNPLISIIAVATLLLSNTLNGARPNALAQVTYSLSNRYSNSFVNEVFADNILLTVAYIDGTVKKNEAIAWSTVHKDSQTSFTLQPGETFAFHDAVLEQYKEKVVRTTNAHFNAVEGFRSDGWLVGDGVCHLASFMYVAAKSAGLEVEAPTSHDFAVIPNIEKRNGVSIYSENTLQNLYITNNKDTPITFVFIHVSDTLTIRVEK